MRQERERESVSKFVAEKVAKFFGQRKSIFFLGFLFLSLTFLSPFSLKVMAASQVVVGGQTNQVTGGVRFETGSVNPMYGSGGEYTFQTYFIDPQAREPKFVKIYLQRGGDGENFESHLMQRGNLTEKGTAYFFKKTLSNKEGIYQFYFEAKVGNKLVHGPAYGSDDCTPGGCGECCGVWGGPKILSTKLIEENKIYLFEKKKNSPLLTYDVGKNWVSAVDISADEKYFAAADNERNVYLFDISQKKLLWQYEAEAVTDTGNLGMDKGLVSFSKNGYLSVSLRGQVFLFKTDQGEPIWSSPTGMVLNGLAISEDAKYIAAGGRDTNVYLWNKDSSTPIWKHKIEAEGGMMGGSVIKTLSMTPDGEYFVVGTSCPDRSIHVFSPKSSEPIFVAKVGINFPVESVSIADDGQSILAGGGGSGEEPYTAVLYKLKQNKAFWTFDTSLNPVNEVAISADGKNCVIGSIIEGIFFNKCADKNPVWQIKNTGYIGHLSFSDDGQYMATGTGTNHVLLVSIAEEEIINDWKTTGKAEAADISSSGRFVAVGTGLNRFFIISAEGENTSGADGREVGEQKIELIKRNPETVSTVSKENKEGFFAKIKTWIMNLFNSSLSQKEKSEQKMTPGGCGNGLCEPDLQENKDSCPNDCTPSNLE